MNNCMLFSSLDKQTVVVSQRQASRRRLVNTKSRISHSRLPTYDFQGVCVYSDM